MPSDEWNKQSLTAIVQTGYTAPPPALVVMQPSIDNASGQPILLMLRKTDATHPAQMLLVNSDAGGGTGLHSPLGRSSSCSSASRKCLSSLVMRRQASAMSDSIDKNFSGLSVHILIKSNGELIYSGGISAFMLPQNSIPELPPTPALPPPPTIVGLSNQRSASLSSSHYATTTTRTSFVPMHERSSLPPHITDTIAEVAPSIDARSHFEQHASSSLESSVTENSGEYKLTVPIL
jgi:hypothetical protein